ncbi:MAG: helix-turn-helix domain-containing protein [Clostridiales bacterium]|nr:helix-turn-helix domain-containing protein [Clostridiales bacterium]
MPKQKAADQTEQRRVELMDHVCYSICIGNEFQTLRAVRERNELGMPGRIPDELTEWKYDLITQKALIMQSLHEIGIPVSLLDRTNTEFIRKIYGAADTGECLRISEQMAVRFCRMNSLKEVRRYSMLVQKVIQETDRDLSQPLTLQYFSNMLNVNSSYLSNLFSKEVGMTLTEYVTAQRISYAADQLLTTQQPIKTIAKKSGIPDVQYFSRLFKRRTGQTPSQYRESYEKILPENQ